MEYVQSFNNPGITTRSKVDWNSPVEVNSPVINLLPRYDMSWDHRIRWNMEHPNFEQLILSIKSVAIDPGGQRGRNRGFGLRAVENKKRGRIIFRFRRLGIDFRFFYKRPKVA